jgi:hypothetical protein
MTLSLSLSSGLNRIKLLLVDIHLASHFDSEHTDKVNNVEYRRNIGDSSEALQNRAEPRPTVT